MLSIAHASLGNLACYLYAAQAAIYCIAAAFAGRNDHGGLMKCYFASAVLHILLFFAAQVPHYPAATGNSAARTEAIPLSSGLASTTSANHGAKGLVACENPHADGRS
jgi:hypothetical protein